MAHFVFPNTPSPSLDPSHHAGGRLEARRASWETLHPWHDLGRMYRFLVLLLTARGPELLAAGLGIGTFCQGRARDAMSPRRLFGPRVFPPRGVRDLD